MYEARQNKEKISRQIDGHCDMVKQRVLLENGKKQIMQMRMFWNNVPSTFTTLNTENKRGNSYYIINKNGFSRLARVNLEPGRDARDQVAQVENDRHMCFGTEHIASVFWDAFENNSKLSVQPQNAGILRHVFFSSNLPDVFVSLIPIKNYSVIDFKLDNYNRIISFHQGHNVYQTPAPKRHYLTTDDL